MNKAASGLGRANFYEQLAQELAALQKAVAHVRGSNAAHAKYWSAIAPNGLNQNETEFRILVRRHAELSVHA